MRFAIAATLFCGLFAGCTMQVVLDAERPFEGVNRQLDRNDIDGRPLSLIVIHGMGTNSAGYSDYMTSQIAKRIGLGSEPEPWTDPEPVDGAMIRTREYVDDAGRALVARELYWRPLSSEERERRLAFDSARPHTDNRLKYNARIKQELLNDRFADSLVYLGPRGLQIRSAARAAFADDLLCAGDVAIVTHSLGSAIAFDTLLELAHTPGAIAAGVRIKLFMLANQIPLLELAREYPVGVEPTTTAKLDIVAIGDPNDILTYSFSEEFKARHRRHGSLAITFTNVRVSIAREAYFGVLANPIRAHTDYYGNGRVIDLIAFGWPSPDVESRKLTE